MRNISKLTISALFVLGVFWYVQTAYGSLAHSGYLVMAALFGAYMAMNIGANDVANNVGPVFGSKAMTMGWAIIIAAVFEALGALVAGGDVVGTIKKGIIDPAAFGSDPMIFIYAMSAALLAAALWLNLATWLKAPVSTTHSIVGGVAGAGIAAGGFSIVSWSTMGKIAASWVISPLLGGLIAAGFLYLIKTQILFREDKLSAAKKFVPILIAIMAAAFIAYLTIKGLKHVWKDLTHFFAFFPQTKKPTFGIAFGLGTAGGIISLFLLRPYIARKVDRLSDSRVDLNTLFAIPLVFSAALLSFAHGANDVANAVGPLAAVHDALTNLAISKKAAIPLWVMVIGGLGISVGLALYGPRLIRTVGSEITELDQMRAFSIMLAAAITVLIASQLGLPVSSTHIAVGAVFGVGFLREWLDSKHMHEREAGLRIEIEKLDRLKRELEKVGEDYKRKVELIEKTGKQKKRICKSRQIVDIMPDGNIGHVIRQMQRGFFGL